MERDLLMREVNNLTPSQDYFWRMPTVPSKTIGSNFSYADKAKMVATIQTVSAAELAIWQGKKEWNTGMYDHVKRYWIEGVGKTASQAATIITERKASLKPGKKHENHWSAAFVSFIMRKAYPNFHKSTAHNRYIIWAKENRKTGNHPFQAFKIDEVSVEPGDIICKARATSGAWATYDNIDNKPESHGDVVTRIENGFAVTVGGNVNANVQERTNSYALDADGKLIQKYDGRKPVYFAVIKMLPFYSKGYTPSYDDRNIGKFSSAPWDEPSYELQEMEGLFSHQPLKKNVFLGVKIDVPKAVMENKLNSSLLGWYKHWDYIIANVLKLGYSPNQETFTVEIARWQKANGLPVNGILDATGWSMIKDAPLFVHYIVQNRKGIYLTKLNATKLNNLEYLINALLHSTITNRYAQAAILTIISKEREFTTAPEIGYANTKNEKIRAIFPTKFPATVSDAQIEALKEKDELFFNYVYGGRNGNAANEGYKYIGRGFNQVTFKGNYKLMGNLIGMDLVTNPTVLENLVVATKVVIAFFKNRFTKATATQLAQYNTTDINGFTSLKDAVMAFYHANAGFGKSYTDVWGRSKAVMSTLTIDQLIPKYTKGKRKSFERITEIFTLLKNFD